MHLPREVLSDTIGRGCSGWDDLRVDGETLRRFENRRYSWMIPCLGQHNFDTRLQGSVDRHDSQTGNSDFLMSKDSFKPTQPPRRADKFFKMSGDARTDLILAAIRAIPDFPKPVRANCTALAAD